MLGSRVRAPKGAQEGTEFRFELDFRGQFFKDDAGYCLRITKFAEFLKWSINHIHTGKSGK